MLDIFNQYGIYMYGSDETGKNLDDEQRVKIGCLASAIYLLAIAAVIFCCAIFTGCSTTKYVPVHDTHEVHHWHTDSVVQNDTTIIDRQTVIMQLDSEAMAKYGIQLKNAERAWLVKTQEMERQLRQLERLSADRDTVRDSIAVPYPVEVIKEVEKPFTWWQTALMWIGLAAIIVLLIIFVRS